MRVHLCLLAAVLLLALTVAAAPALARPQQLTKAQVKIACRHVPHSCARWAPLVNRYWSKYLLRRHHRIIGVRELRVALWVMWYESGGCTSCQTGDHIGLFQCSAGFYGSRPRWTALSQIATAAMLYARRSWQPWQCTVGLARAKARQTSYAP